MSEYIDRQDAIDALMEKDKKLRNINWYDKPYAEVECRGIDEALSIISNLPSAQPERIPATDVVPVVRCKDCKHHAYDEIFCCYWCEYPGRVRDTTPDGFCDKGEE